MAEYEHLEAPTAQTDQRPGLGVGMFASWIGAGLSLALAIAIGMWAYQTIMRDVSGVPVIKASSDPMRVAPENPGGLSAQNKGLSVNRVAEEVASKAPDQVMLAPSPVSLSEDDLASGALRAQNSENSSVVLNAPIPLDINNLPDDILSDSGARDGRALPANGTIRKQSDSIEDALKLALQNNESSVGLAQAIRPPKRPSNLAPIGSARAAQVASVRDLSPSDISAGSALVQLGAFDSEAVAKAEWQRLDKRFSSFMRGRDRLIVKATSGGRDFYRLRAVGFADIDDAKRFCATMVAGDVDCIPILAR